MRPYPCLTRIEREKKKSCLQAFFYKIVCRNKTTTKEIKGICVCVCVFVHIYSIFVSRVATQTQKERRLLINTKNLQANATLHFHIHSPSFFLSFPKE